MLTRNPFEPVEVETRARRTDRPRVIAIAGILIAAACTLVDVSGGGHDTALPPVPAAQLHHA